VHFCRKPDALFAMLAFGTTTAFVAVARMNAKDRIEVRILMRSDYDKLKGSDRQRTRAAESFKMIDRRRELLNLSRNMSHIYILLIPSDL
jgi:hypothetical protein